MKFNEYGAVQMDTVLLCLDCANARYGASEVSQMVEDGDAYPIFPYSEWDYFPTCDECGRELDYVNLTSEGKLWLARQTEPCFDRFDVVEAHWCLADSDGKHAIEERLDFVPSPRLINHGWHSLTYNGLAIYVRLLKRG